MVDTQISRLFVELLAKKRREVVLQLPRLAVSEEYRGFFVDSWFQESSEAARKRELFYELDGMVNAQSVGFMIDLLPRMYPFLMQMEGRGRYLDALDVGSRTGAGAGLLSDLFMSHFSSLPTYFDTIDIDSTFGDYQLSRWPMLRHAITGDIFQVEDRSYDYVICSHVIEHLSEPSKFIAKLSRIARDYVFLYCPYEEKDPIPGHHTVTRDFIDSLSPCDVQVFDSWWWRPQGVPSPVVFFVLKAGL